MAQASRDQNQVTTLLAVSNVDGVTPVVLWADPTTHRLLVDLPGGGGGGTVTDVSVVTANGVSGSVANSTTTPAITLTLGDITPSSVVSAGVVRPSADDGAALGVAGTAWADLFLADGGIINFNNGDVLITHSTNLLTFSAASNGYRFANGPISPSSNDSVAIGEATRAWSDLFLASGAVINFNNGNMTLTHSAGVITIGGGNLALGANSLTMTGSIAATGARVTKGWFTDLEISNMPTVGGTSLSSTFSPIAGSASIVTVGTITAGVWNGTDIAVADGGTGASTAAGARTNLDAQEDISGATLTAVSVATNDKVLIQDTSDSDNLKTVTAQSIADLASGGSFTPRVSYSTLFETAGRFSTAHSGGTSTFGVDGVSLDTTSTGSRVAAIFITASGAEDFVGSPFMTSRFRFTTLGTTGQLWIIAGDKGTGSHFGFKVLIASSIASLHATQADGSTENASAALTTFAVNNTVYLCAKKNSTNSVDYYWRVNTGAWSSATNLTANMPTTNNTPMYLEANNLATATQHIVKINSFSFEG